MDKWIKSISGEIPNTNTLVNINLDGKNLIVTGANGSGKTSFLNAVYKKVHMQVTHSRDNLSQQDEEKLFVEIPNKIEFSSKHDRRRTVIRLYKEKRLSKIIQPVMAKAVYVEAEIAKQQSVFNTFANNLEQHLVNLKSRQALAIAINNDQALADSIEKWFVNFEKTLKILFEDPSVQLKFNPDNFQFSICQENKPPYTFQTISEGYRAIFDIYAELIMRMEYFKIMPEDLTGVVLIDEIESHLHVSLQRLIYPFFAESFPNIQFIVTTYSPFVLMSASDTVIFDLINNEQITEDLSYYSYPAVIKKLWNLKPVSVNLEKIIKEIAKIVNSGQIDLSRLRKLTNQIKGHEDVLDKESKAFYLLGLETLGEANRAYSKL
jgi:predicted ATP-binding protein involved in virulence